MPYFMVWSLKSFPPWFGLCLREGDRLVGESSAEGDVGKRAFHFKNTPFVEACQFKMRVGVGGDYEIWFVADETKQIFITSEGT